MKLKKVCEIDLPLPESRNRQHSKHWGIYKRKKQEWEDIGFYEVQRQNLKGLKIRRAILHFEFFFKGRRRDLDNYFCSYEVKGLIDGVSKALSIDDSFNKLSISVEGKKADFDGLKVTVFVEEVD